MKKSKKEPQTVEAEILKVTGCKSRSKKESDQEYLERLARSVDDWCREAGKDAEARDARYETISEATQDWCSSASQAANDKQDIPDFPDAEDTTSEDEDADDQPPEGEEKPVKTKKERGAKKAPKEKVAKPKKEKKARGPGKHYIFRKMIVLAYRKKGEGKLKFNPLYDSYLAKVGDDPITKPSASVVFSNTVQTLEIEAELGS